ncbi:unnamed protein product [Tilletia controversa]|uniref:Signal recognition particle receptor subunit beta n=1 Tax=Tilletia controversa TaxID=13291 RepID=A0A8X7N0V3_9BASI|nr:hypothetical protein CF328_g1804 [Tilletia controversa]KAE8254838.1 hypothetical protein A4X06_0g724 [Tilletia controversa]CAD6918197.1 unnamed protein product [Tilletia controversa]CAD6954851.1 unnamed protein product [Tilletia controversa]CAD6955582.1 unnamed protein product [Tilletia controversa]
MAFLAPAIRWPDALHTYLQDAGLLDPTSLQPSPILLFATALGFIVITTALTYTFRATPGAITAQPVSVASRANDSDEKTRSKKKQPLSTALLGPQGSGKTALYSTLLYGQTPHTQTSQQSSSVQLVLSDEGKGRKANVVLHDVPGHPRLRPLGKHVQIVMGADVLLFCVDTVGALGGGGGSGASSGAGAGAAGTETFGAAVDYLHSTLMALARQRLSSSNKNKPASPPAFAILLTRADLSPLLASTTSSAKDQETDEGALAARAKRHQAASAVLLSRARTALESELRKRRAADVDLASAASASVAGAQSKAKIGGMGEVARGEGESDGGVLKQVLGLFGLGGILGSSSKGGSGLVDEDDGRDAGGDEDGVLDYYLGAGVGGGGAGSSSFSLEKLDPEVVLDGEVPILLSTVGRERGWEAGGASAAGSGAGFDGLGELKKWIVDLV